MTKNLQGIILAAGKSERLKTGNTKLIEKMCGQELILYPTNLLASLQIPMTIIIGYQKQMVRTVIMREYGESVNFVVQEKQFGTGHAILCAREHFQKEHILILSGDIPLVTGEIIEDLYRQHVERNASISLVTAHSNEPVSLSYDRIITRHDGKNEQVIEVIRAENFAGDPYEFCCVDAGIYIVSRKFFEEHITAINHDKLDLAFHLSDLITIANNTRDRVHTISAPFDRIRGVNTLQELWSVEQIKRSELIKYWMEKGVRFIVAQSTHLDLNIEIGSGTTIGAGVHLMGKTHIGKRVTIHPFSIIENSTIEDGAIIHPYSHIRNSRIGSFSTHEIAAHGAQGREHTREASDHAHKTPRQKQGTPENTLSE